MKLTDEQQGEISEARNHSTPTKRPTVPSLEAILYEAFPVLDQGFIRVVDYMGDDAAIVQAARVSYGKGTKKVQEDRGLINYLMRHQHTTPFEMAEIKLHVKLPIFVARQWVRHRTANINEYSARYSILDKEFYIPAPQHLAAQSNVNRQGRGNVLEGEEAATVLGLLKQDAEVAYEHYLEMLNQSEDGQSRHADRSGLARELARMNLPLSFYTQWYWKIDLHNLMGFLRLRADAHAQFEIRAYADKMLEILKAWVPISYDAFIEHRLNAVSLSATAVQVVKDALSGKSVSQKQSKLSQREWAELVSVFGALEGGGLRD